MDCIIKDIRYIIYEYCLPKTDMDALICELNYNIHWSKIERDRSARTRLNREYVGICFETYFIYYMLEYNKSDSIWEILL